MLCLYYYACADFICWCCLLNQQPLGTVFHRVTHSNLSIPIFFTLKKNSWKLFFCRPSLSSSPCLLSGSSTQRFTWDDFPLLTSLDFSLLLGLIPDVGTLLPSSCAVLLRQSTTTQQLCWIKKYYGREPSICLFLSHNFKVAFYFWCSQYPGILESPFTNIPSLLLRQISCFPYPVFVLFPHLVSKDDEATTCCLAYLVRCSLLNKADC